MKIGKVIKESDIPQHKTKYSQFDSVREKAKLLKKGEYLTVTFDEKKEACSCVNSLKASGYDTRRRGTIVYVGPVSKHVKVIKE